MLKILWLRKLHVPVREAEGHVGSRAEEVRLPKPV